MISFTGTGSICQSAVDGAMEEGSPMVGARWDASLQLRCKAVRDAMVS